MTTTEIRDYLISKGFKYNEETRTFINKKYNTSCYFNRRQSDMKVHFYSEGIAWLVDDMSISDSINNGYFGLIR